MKRKWTLELVREEMAKRGCVLLSDSYESHTPVDYVAACGHRHSTLFSNIMHGLCLKCPDCSGYRKHTVDEVRGMMERAGCKLLSEEYVNAHSKLRYVAACGHESETTYSEFKSGKGVVCRKCAMKNAGKRRRISEAEIRRRLAEEGCELLEVVEPKMVGTIRYVARCGHENTIRLGLFLNNGEGRLCGKCTAAGASAEEHEVFEYMSSIYGGRMVEHDRSFGPEIDIYLPDLKLGIEYDGLRWHSEGMHRDKCNLARKTAFFADRGIRIVHIFDCEWRGRKELVKSMLADRVGVHRKRYFARKMEVRGVPSAEKAAFLDENHIQGNDRAQYAIGLYDRADGLVSVMTFGRRRITGGGTELEMIRFCNRKFTTVVGGASRLLSHFVAEHPEFAGTELKTYANKRYSVGGLYSRLGFVHTHDSKPCYYYFKGNSALFHRAMFQKHKLPSLLADYSPDRTEWENMQANGYDRVFDCGNMVFSMEIGRLPVSG